MSPPIIDLNIHSLRNISAAKLAFHPRCNVIFGPNGSGKTSLLEAIYLLSTGHSFRTREISPLISHEESMLTVFARTATSETISIQKSLTGPTLVKLNAQTCHSSSELAHFLPCQIFYQDIFQIIDAGPSVRRALLDWGLFHVEPSYHSIWKQYRMVLKQRNALLRQKAAYSQVIPWDNQLVTFATQLHQMRSNYFEKLTVSFQIFLEKLTDVPCSITYYKGWDRKESNKQLADILLEQYANDIQRQFTHSGPHQADIIFDLSSKKAKQLLSRGQQKIVLIALKLAQSALVEKNCIYLFDDISSELDAQHLARLISCLKSVTGQLFITAIDPAINSFMEDLTMLNTYEVKEGKFIGR